MNTIQNKYQTLCSRAATTKWSLRKLGKWTTEKHVCRTINCLCTCNSMPFPIPIRLRIQIDCFESPLLDMDRVAETRTTEQIYRLFWYDKWNSAEIQNTALFLSCAELPAGARIKWFAPQATGRSNSMEKEHGILLLILFPCTQIVIKWWFCISVQSCAGGDSSAAWYCFAESGRFVRLFPLQHFYALINGAKWKTIE